MDQQVYIYSKKQYNYFDLKKKKVINIKPEAKWSNYY
jgi:hypothetical protein